MPPVSLAHKVDVQDDEVEDFADMLEDVFEDEEEMQVSFRAEVEKLVEASSGSEVGGGHASFQAVAHQIIHCMPRFCTGDARRDSKREAACNATGE